MLRKFVGYVVDIVVKPETKMELDCEEDDAAVFADDVVHVVDDNVAAATIAPVATDFMLSVCITDGF
jgi:hypothetical protein